MEINLEGKVFRELVDVYGGTCSEAVDIAGELSFLSLRVSHGGGCRREDEVAYIPVRSVKGSKAEELGYRFAVFGEKEH